MIDPTNLSSIDTSVKYNVYYTNTDGSRGSLIKGNLTYVDTIPPGLPLNDDQVRKWFKTEPGDYYWRVNHKANPNYRIVFDRLIVPVNPKWYIIEVAEDE